MAQLKQPDWQSDDGAVLLYCGDCLEILPTLADGSVNAVITDPPYGTTKQAWDTGVNESLHLSAYHRLAGECGNVLVFSQQPVASRWVAASPGTFRYELIWQKTHPTGWLSSGCRPLRSHENILVFAQKFGNQGADSFPCTYNPQLEERDKPVTRNHVNTYTNIYDGDSASKLNGKTFTYSHRHPKSVLTFARDGHRGTVHPNAKPVALMGWLIKSYSNENDVILDPFMGSGTTGVACVKTGRKFIGIELDESYFQIAVKRIQDAIREKAGELVYA